jgi:hypothetical protein
MNNKNNKLVLDIIKVIFFILIVLSPFISYPKFLNNQFLLIIFVILIIIASFIDIQLSIIMTIGFLILMINLNKDKIKKIKKESYSQPENIYNSPEMTEIKTPPFFETMVKMPKTHCNDMRFYKNQVSNDLFDLYIDDKVKPYEEFIKKLTNPTHLDIVQNNEIL